jgi:hypothetical protein
MRTRIMYKNEFADGREHHTNMVERAEATELAFYVDESGHEAAEDVHGSTS